MFELLKSILTGQNAFASGGLVLMIIGGLSLYLRAMPESIWRWIVRQTTIMITVKDDDAAFVWVKEWFLEQKFLTHIRNVDLDTTLRNERIALIPAPGKHWFWYGKKPFEVWFSRTESSREYATRRTSRSHSGRWAGIADSYSVLLTTLCAVTTSGWECSRTCTRTTMAGIGCKGTRPG
jgi:mitochondrial chaperone BCS1